MEIACLVPTYKRADKILPLLRNFKETSKKSNIYFIITPDDTESKRVLDDFSQKYWVVDLEYTQSINYGVKHTTEPFVLCASDDIEFMPGWEDKLLELTKDPTKHIFGGIDCWRISKTMCHISHPLVRRSYIEKQEDGNLYYREYIHYMNDIELIQRGLKEGCVSITPETLIEHNHPLVLGKPEKEWDKTYQRSSTTKEHDFAIYERRKAEFEMIDHNFFHESQMCYAIPTKLNPLYNKTLVSIVIPSWNDADFLIQCLQSIAKETYYRYEVIIIDDCSDELQKGKDPWNLVKTKELLDAFEFADKSCEIRVVHNKEHKWINYAWELGSKMAKGQYVVLANSDITFSTHWDKFLVGALEFPERKFAISCPFELNPEVNKPYDLIPLFKKHCPNMIKGPCFMFRKKDFGRLFPIPKEIKHWCGDNVIADRASKFGGVIFTSLAQIYHYVTQSGKRMEKSAYTERICADVLAYEKWSGKDMSYVKEILPFPKYYSDFGEDKWIEEHCKLPKKGFYVDVGAGAPENSSNTKFLEDKGWEGVCIDADPAQIALLKEGRKAEIIQAAVSDKEEEVVLNIAECAFLTSLNEIGTNVIKKETVMTKRLKDLVKRHIDYLSIDVEGNELKVCDGMDWSDPPDVIIVEHLTLKNPSKRDEIIEYFNKLPYKLVHENRVNLIFQKV